VGVKSLSVSVRNLGYRWVPAQKTASWLSIEVYDGPPKVIDYIIVHELCHLHHRDHTDAFWNEVDKVLPDYREERKVYGTMGQSLICRQRIYPILERFSVYVEHSHLH